MKSNTRRKKTGEKKKNHGKERRHATSYSDSFILCTGEAVDKFINDRG